MYGILTYIWLILMVNVGRYTIHGSYRCWTRVSIVGKLQHSLNKKTQKQNNTSSFHYHQGISISPWFSSYLSRWFSELPQVGYVNFLEGTPPKKNSQLVVFFNLLDPTVRLSGWNFVVSKTPYLGVSENGGNPQIIHFNGDFHYIPSILGVPLFLETPIFGRLDCT